MANDPQGSAKRHADVVTRVFPQAVSLFDYCSAVIDFQGSEKLIMPADPVSYSNLLSDTLILPPAATTKYIVTKVSKYPIRDTIGRLVSQCVRSNPSYHEQNCLALGYRSKTSNCDATMRTSNDTELYFVNTIQAIVTTQTWQLFANRVGEEIVRHIFSLPVFVPTENMCFIQVSGVSASELVFKEAQQQSKGPESTAQSSGPTALVNACMKARQKSSLEPVPAGTSPKSFRALYDAERRTPLNFLSTTIPLPRHRIFYNAKYEKTIGLPKKHPLRKDVQACESLVDTVFLPSLALLEYAQARAMRKALKRLFKLIRRAYRTCAMHALLEKHCSLADVIKNAQSLVEEDPVTEPMDTSALFATPASRPSNAVCGSTGSARGATQRKPEASTSSSQVPMHLTGVSETLSTSQSGVTWRGTASTTNSGMKMTLTSSTEQDITVTSSTTFDTGPSATTGVVPPELPTDDPAEESEVQTQVPAKRKRRRGCRAGKQRKERVEARENAAVKQGRKVKGGAGSAENAKKGKNSKLTWTEEIRANVEQLAMRHAERALITVGEKLVNNIVQNVNADAKYQEIHTQSPVPSVSSPAAFSGGGSASQTPGRPAYRAPPAESETTYASAPSVVHRGGSDKKRKVVSILENAEHGSQSLARREDAKLIPVPRVDEAACTLSTPIEEFQYLCDSATPSTAAPFGTGSASRLSSSKKELRNMAPPPCPDKIGDLRLKDCSRNRRKKIKAKFRQLFRKQAKYSAEILNSGGEYGGLPSPILPNTLDSGLLAHFNRPYLTEVASPDRTRKRKAGDLRGELFPSSADSPAALSDVAQNAKRKKTARLDELLETSDLLSLSVPASKVAAFVKAVCREMFPQDTVWGCRRNRDLFLSAVEVFVKLGRHETLQQTQVVAGMRISDIPWLQSEAESHESPLPVGSEKSERLEPPQVDESQHTLCSTGTETSSPQSMEVSSPPLPAPAKSEEPSRPSKRAKRASKVESAAREQLLYRFVEWVFAEVVVKLIGVCFYATEVEGRGSEVLYYRKPVWARIVNKGKQQLFANFVPLVCSEEAHLAFTTTTFVATAAAPTSPLKRTATNEATAGALPLSPGAQLRRAATAPSGLNKLATGATAETVDTFKRAGSLLFNDILRAKQYTVPSLSEQNNTIIAQLPQPKTTTAVVRTHQNLRLKNFLLRLPIVRFVPKKSSVRAITNLRTRRSANGQYNNGNNTFSSSTGQQFGEVLTNSALYNCLHVLKSVHGKNPELAGFGAFGLDDIYLKFRKYKDQVRESRPELFAQDPQPAGVGAESAADAGADAALGEQRKPVFYVAVLDLEKCYDNVNPQKLYDLLKHILSDSYCAKSDQPMSPLRRTTSAPAKAGADKPSSRRASTENVIHKYSVTHPIKSMDRNISKNVRYVTQGGEIVPFREASEEIAQNYPYSIITDNVVYPKISNQEVLRLLKIHLFQHAVKIPSSSSGKAESGGPARAAVSSFEYFTQVKGIPQGSVLSPLLCTFYYGDAESSIFGSKRVIDKIGIQDRTMVVRLMDDYIVVSTEQSCVQEFLQLAHQSLKSYGAGVNPLKTRVNFDAAVDVDGAHIPLQRIEGEEMPWCGLQINTRTLEVTCHFARILDRPLVHSVLTEYGKSGAAFRRSIKTFMRMKCHAIVLDEALNSKTTVLQTLYTMYLIVAMRTFTYIKQLRKVYPAVRNDRHLQRCINEGVTFGARLISTRTLKKTTRRMVLGSADEDDTALRQRGRRGEGGAEDPQYSSGDAVDIALFAQCVATADPECFGSCAVTFSEANWLGLQAFLSVFGKQRSHFWPVLRALEKAQARFAPRAEAAMQPDVPGWIEVLRKCEEVLETSQWR